MVHDAAAPAGLKGAAGAAAACLAAAAVLSACGGSEGGRAAAGGPVTWVKTPELLVRPSLPNDRILAGRIRNDSRKPITLQAKDVEVVGGRDGGGRFVDTFVHGNIPVELVPGPNQALPARRRLGYTVTLKPGKTAPLVATWRVQPGRRATAVALRPGMRLRVPGAKPKPVP